MHDIAIIGAGPAGAMLARLVGQQYRVLLVEKRPLDGPDTPTLGKCCGGLLAPDAQAMLSRLGLGLPKSVLQDPQLFVVRAIDVTQRLERYYQRHYINMDRRQFDRWLLSMVPGAVDTRPGCQLRACVPEGNGFRLTLKPSGRPEHTETARIVIGADGAASKVRAQFTPDSPSPQAYFAIQEWVQADASMPYFSSIFDPRITDYYCWTIPKDGLLIIGAALRPRDRPIERFELLKQELRDYGFVFGKAVRREGAFMLRPRSARQISTGTKGIALVGEAAGWISPSSAEGLSYAFRSACILAEVLHAGLENFERRYHRETMTMRRNIVLKSLKSCVVFSPSLRKIVMKLGIRSMDICGLNSGTVKGAREELIPLEQLLKQ
jgi:flavin-dependent dehydrogenase